MEVIFYEKENGEIPVKEFLDNLDKKNERKSIRTNSYFRRKG